MKKSSIKKFQKGSETYLLGVIARFAYLFGVLALIYGFFMSPIFMAPNMVIMAILLIGSGVYLGKKYKEKSKKSLWW
mgnify:CR=1 FL=1